MLTQSLAMLAEVRENSLPKDPDPLMTSIAPELEHRAGGRGHTLVHEITKGRPDQGCSSVMAKSTEAPRHHDSG
jgi:hypothetical protein